MPYADEKGLVLRLARPPGDLSVRWGLEELTKYLVALLSIVRSG
ncbi:MAG TPA: hypothetical protein VIO11_08325 [Candidatus Methanoperedens sp.]